MTRNVRGGGACDYYLDGVSVDSYPVLSYNLFCRTYCSISNLLIFALRAVHLHPCTHRSCSASLLLIYSTLPLLRVAEKESINKMSLHNLATVFGPTLLRPAEKDSKIPANPTQPISMGDSWSLEVMAQVSHTVYLQSLPSAILFVFSVKVLGSLRYLYF